MDEVMVLRAVYLPKNTAGDISREAKARGVAENRIVIERLCAAFGEPVPNTDDWIERQLR